MQSILTLSLDSNMTMQLESTLLENESSRVLFGT